MLFLFLQSVTDTWEMIDHRCKEGVIYGPKSPAFYFGISDAPQKSVSVNCSFLMYVHKEAKETSVSGVGTI